VREISPALEDTFAKLDGPNKASFFRQIPANSLLRQRIPIAAPRFGKLCQLTLQLRSEIYFHTRQSRSTNRACQRTNAGVGGGFESMSRTSKGPRFTPSWTRSTMPRMETFQDRVIAAIEKKIPNSRCPLCQASDWAVEPADVRFRQHFRSGGAESWSDSSPCAVLVCNVCGNVQFVSLKAYGDTFKKDV
jgi:RNase P subunit RPR2